jgi:ribosomal protein S18 acetylase RimI-like enzyme
MDVVDDGQNLRVVQLDPEAHRRQLSELWRAATAARREAVGLPPLDETDADVLSRPGAFGVGLVERSMLLAIAVAMPARADDGRSPRQVPGLLHISSVATRPGSWGRGFGRRVVQAILSQGKRRGFARAQLFVHSDNAGARHLYESLGFTWSRRAAVDSNGEDIVHYVIDLVATPAEPRPAARLLCCDPRNRVLLLHWRDPYDGFELWEPPGGGIEEGEDPRTAVLREWAEETGLAAPGLVGEPVVVGRDLFWLGERFVCDEFFFLGRAASADDPDVSGQTEIEHASYLGHAWIGWDEIADLGGLDKPDVVAVLRRLDPEGPWKST